MPSFSPDGRRIVYFVTPLANTCGNDPCPAQGTYVKALDERGPGNRISPYGEYPDWSPTGDRIVFTKYGTDAPAGAEPQLQVYVVNADGSGERRLTNSLTRTAADPAWSPDGSKIVFVGQDNGAPGLGSASSSLYVMNADGTDLHAIAGTSGASLSPTWSPDGTRVAYMVRATSGSVAPKTRIVDLRTGRVAPLADDWNVGWPAWSADGAIAVAKDVGPGGTGPTSVGVSVWLMNSDGTNRRQLVGPNQNGVGYLAFSRR
jgi:Tol biopolymer transport system component